VKRSRGLRRGVVLFDVILGTTLIVIVGVAFVTLLGQSFATVDQLRQREREIARAAGVLERMSALWSVGDFESHRGRFRWRGFDATVSAVAPNLFDVSILDTARAVALLHTTIYTPDTTNAGR
jgi:hypothetical protein